VSGQLKPATHPKQPGFNNRLSRPQTSITSVDTASDNKEAQAKYLPVLKPIRLQATSPSIALS
jgi:hypothetical protein